MRPTRTSTTPVVLTAALAAMLFFACAQPAIAQEHDSDVGGSRSRNETKSDTGARRSERDSDRPGTVATRSRRDPDERDTDERRPRRDPDEPDRAATRSERDPDEQKVAAEDPPSRRQKDADERSEKAPERDDRTDDKKALPTRRKPKEDPHDELVSSRFGCLACHGPRGDIFGLVEGRHSRVGPASDEACLGCHTGGGRAPQVYGGSEAAYRARNDHGHNDPSKVSCIDCHSIHGPVLEGRDNIARKLLKELDYQRVAVKTYRPRTASRDEALAVWCTGCHKDSWPQGEGARSVSSGPRSPAAYDAHPLKKADGVIAFGDATSCRSCHAAGSPDGVGAGDFPHYTPDAAGMLVGADSATGKVTGMRDADSDGVCLRCHRTGAGPAAIGVGATY